MSENTEYLTEERLAEIEARDRNSMAGKRRSRSEEDRTRLLAEVRRLRSLLAEIEGLPRHLADEYYPDGEYVRADDLDAILRRAIGEPVRYIGQPQSDAIIQEMIDDGAIGEPEQRQSEEA